MKISIPMETLNVDLTLKTVSYMDLLKHSIQMETLNTDIT